MTGIGPIKTPEQHKYIVIGEVHKAQILHQTIFQILLRDVLRTCQVKHLKGIDDIEVGLES